MGGESQIKRATREILYTPEMHGSASPVEAVVRRLSQKRLLSTTGGACEEKRELAVLSTTHVVR